LFGSAAVLHAELSSARSQVESQLRIALESSTSPAKSSVVVMTAKIGLETVIDVIGEVGFVVIANHLFALSLGVAVGSPIS